MELAGRREDIITLAVYGVCQLTKSRHSVSSSLYFAMIFHPRVDRRSLLNPVIEKKMTTIIISRAAGMRLWEIGRF